ncbi:hypothetical protein CXB51_017861 [Gossypium anomalum]|uniref:Integrase catalytic domain-containing protein n=1 Tax=Gossypium anomalum TaxID=47600 RepID=A0A8J5Z7G3_9ROSI|nr:hypothetical protein CXB51_017861 [Gossypium anomalum]
MILKSRWDERSPLNVVGCCTVQVADKTNGFAVSQNMGLSSYLWNALPFMAMITVECTDVGISVISKAALNKGMSNVVSVTYFNALGTLILLPYFILCRDKQAPLTFSLLWRFFLLGLIGSSGQIIFLTGVKFSSPTLSSALVNLIPIFTFLLAVIFRMEKLEMRKSSSQAKLLGAIVAVTGAFVVTLYKGPPVLMSSSPSDFLHHPFDSKQSKWIIGGLSEQSKWIIGGFLILLVCLSSATWNVLQAATVREYTDKMTIVFFFTFFIAIQSLVFSVILERNPTAWRLKSTEEVAAILCSAPNNGGYGSQVVPGLSPATAWIHAVFGSLYRISIHTWCLEKKGPVYVSMFKPLGIAVAVALTVIFLGESLFLGSVIGSIIILVGFYTVIWGQANEKNMLENEDMDEWVDLKADDSFSKATVEQHLNQFKSIVRQHGAEFEAKLQEIELIPNPDCYGLVEQLSICDKVVTSFPRHDVVKLDDITFIQWRQQVRLILGGYGLLRFVDGTVSPPSRFVASPDGSLVPNTSAQVFDQQDQLLTSWLLSTISSSCLSSFTDARSACDVWTTATSLFAADTGAKQSWIRHELHSLKKGALSIKEYVAKIKNLCALLAASGTRISEEEKVQVTLAGLPSDFDAVVSSVSLASEPVPFQRFVEALLECENRQLRAVQEVVMHANLVEGVSSPTSVSSARGGRPPASGRGRGFRPRVQCLICNRIGHLAQKCYYRFRQDFDGPPAEARASDAAPALGGARSVHLAPQRDFSDGVGGPSFQRMRFTHSPGQNQFQFGQNQHAFRPNYAFGQNWNPAGYYGGPHGALDSHVPRPGPSRPNLANDLHGSSGPFATYNKFGARNFGGHLNECGLVSNYVQVGYPLSHDPVIGDGCDPSAPPIPWRTKPRARVYSGSDPCIGLPRVGDLHASNFSAPDSHVNTAQVGSNGGDTDGYIPVPVGSASWYPDSGASNHVCRDASALQGSSPYFSKSSLLMGDGTPAPISSAGSCVLPTQSKLLRLSDVLCVPRICKNLMSVSQFTKDNNLPEMSRPTASVPVAASIEFQNKPNKGDVFSLWHKCLGHLSTCVVKSILSKCNVVLAKDCLDGGPASVSCGNNWYYIAFVDFQSDWGGEYHAFTSLLASQGIIHCITCPHTSEQNGVVERKHRHIVNMGLTLLAQAGLSMEYWGYAFCCAVHLINRLPTVALKGQTPFQALYGHAPTYDHLRMFSPHHKGYQCRLPSGKIVVSRHVVFDEARFLSSTAAPNSAPVQSSSVPTFVPLVRSPLSQFVAVPRSDASSPDQLSPLGSCSSVSIPAKSGVGSDREPGRCLSGNSVSSGATAVEEGLASHFVVDTNVSNTHPMVTRAKAGIFKPKVMNVEVTEPSTIEEALSTPEWRSAAEDEYDALVRNSTWELVPLPLNRKVIGCKWLFKVKKNPDGTIDRRKARLVAKGCSQVPGCDFKETFSPVIKPPTIRLILSIAVTKGWSLRQVDVNNAFLNGDLTDEVFMQQLSSYVQLGPNGEQLVCRLTKALYGLRQDPRAWFIKLRKFLVSSGFVISKSDASLFVRVSSEFTLYVLVYVDDIVITGSSSDEINCFVQRLHNEFALKDMGELNYFLGIEVNRSSSGSLHLSQRKYIRELLTRSSMANAKGAHTPMVSSSALSKNEGEPLADPTEYRSLVGALQYVVLTRPNVAYTVNRVCQFMHAPTSSHMVALKRILRYLCGTFSHGLVFRPSDRLSLVGYANANWGLDFDDRRSTTGYCIYFGYTPISWCSKKQPVVSRSTVEAEYRSLAAATSDVTWLISLLAKLKVNSVDLPTIWCDNSSAVAVAANPVLHSKFKHVEIDLFFVCEKVASGDLIVGEVPACDQVADILTKPLSASLFSRFRHLLRVLPLEEAGYSKVIKSTLLLKVIENEFKQVEIGDDSEQVLITKLEDGDVVEPMEPESIDKYVKVNNNEKQVLKELELMKKELKRIGKP